MKLLSPVCRVVATVALAALSFGAQSVPVYSLADNGSALIRFDSASPDTVTTVGLISGAVTSLSGLDFRPADGLLYGFQQSSSGIYTVNPATGATTFVSTSSSAVTGTGVRSGIDFNPVADRLRVVSTSGNNLRINVATGAATADTPLAYAAGDPNAGATPNIVDSAYTFSNRSPTTVTTLYYIDSLLDILVTTSNPNGGILTTVGRLGVDTSNSTGFDILTALSGNNTAFASLQVGGVDGLYTINLGTGAATLVGAISARNLSGLAVQPTAIPEPGTLALFGLAVLAFGITRRRAAGGLVKTPATRV